VDTLSITVQAAALAIEHELFISPNSNWNKMDFSWELIKVSRTGETHAYIEVQRVPIVGILDI
jgi:hypothetical protein